MSKNAAGIDTSAEAASKNERVVSSVLDKLNRRKMRHITRSKK